MSAIDSIFIFLYILCGYATFIFIGNHFGRSYAILGFVLGYLVAWGAKRLILRLIFSNKSPRRKDTANKLPPSKK